MVERDGRYVMPGTLAAHAAPDVDRHHRERGGDEGAVRSGARPSAPWRRTSSRGSGPATCSPSPGGTLKFVRVRDMVAHVRRSTAKSTSVVPALDRRAAAALARSSPPAIRDQAGRGAAGDVSTGPRWRRCGRSWSCRRTGRDCPRADELLIERVRDPRRAPPLLLSGRRAAGARGTGRAVRLPHRAARPDLLHPGGQRLRLRAALARAARRSRRRSRPGCCRPSNLLHDIPASLNAAELARRQFREIARVAGLVFQGYPGANKARKAGAGLERA